MTELKVILITKMHAENHFKLFTIYKQTTTVCLKALIKME